MLFTVRSGDQVWYGKPDMPDRKPDWFTGVFPDEWTLVDECNGSKGDHAATYYADFVLYDPVELAAVAAGILEPHEPMPYARFRPPELFDTCNYLLGGVAFDSAAGRLYIIQRNSEDTVMHVWQIKDSTPVSDPVPDPEPTPDPIPDLNHQAIMDQLETIEKILNRIEQFIRDIRNL